MFDLKTNNTKHTKFTVYTDYNDIDKGAWNYLLAASKNASFFQSPECYRLYASMSFMKPVIYAIGDSNDIQALMCGYLISDGNCLKRFFSRRVIVPGGALISDNCSDDAVSCLLKFMQNDLAQRAIYIEFRNYHDYSKYRHIFEENGFDYHEHYNVQIDTSDYNKTLQRIQKSKFRQINNALKSGEIWSESKDENDITAFYMILSDMYKHKIKRPLFPKEFFSKCVQTDYVKLLIVKRNNIVTGGMLCPVFNRAVTYEWFVCGGILSTFAGIEYSINNDIQLFDFMGAGESGKPYGVRDFKLCFGGNLQNQGRFTFRCNTTLYSIGKFYIHLCSKI